MLLKLFLTFPAELGLWNSVWLAIMSKWLLVTKWISPTQHLHGLQFVADILFLQGPWAFLFALAWDKVWVILLSSVAQRLLPSNGCVFSSNLMWHSWLLQNRGYGEKKAGSKDLPTKAKQTKKNTVSSFSSNRCCRNCRQNKRWQEWLKVLFIWLAVRHQLGN